jgi:hypothetical protein
LCIPVRRSFHSCFLLFLFLSFYSFPCLASRVPFLLRNNKATAIYLHEIQLAK